jgi:hypothetical protein
VPELRPGSAVQQRSRGWQAIRRVRGFHVFPCSRRQIRQ